MEAVERKPKGHLEGPCSFARSWRALALLHVRMKSVCLHQSGDALPRYGDLIEDAKREGRASAFALPSGVLMGLVNAWQYFQGGVRFPFLKPPVLSGPVRPFYGVYASPRPLAHFDLLIEWLQNRSSQPRRALDLGTGCGVVTLILQRIAWVEEVVASDISPNAVYGATEEFKRHGLGVEVVCSDLFCELKGSFDLVVFNPPWLPLPKVDNEPRTALDGGNFYPEDLFRRFFDGLPEAGVTSKRHWPLSKPLLRVVGSLDL